MYYEPRRKLVQDGRFERNRLVDVIKVSGELKEQFEEGYDRRWCRADGLVVVRLTSGIEASESLR